MKKYIISAISGALCMFLALSGIAFYRSFQTTKKYEHIDFVSDLTQEDCFVCGNASEHPLYPYWGKDNVGIINLNTFETMYIEINRYSNNGELLSTPAGYQQISHLIGDNTSAHAYAFPDNAYAQAEITGVQYAIDRKLIQRKLCQTCLDSINSLWYTDKPPAEYAIISFEKRTIQPLLNSHPWFSAGNFGIDCEFKDKGAIDLLIHYCPFRYEK